MRRFEDNPDNAPEKQTEYKAVLESMTDEQLAEECRRKIWLSAYANNNPISCYHWKCDATYDECARREKPTIYSKAWDEQVKACR